ncbi:MAG: hypothetical protein CMJ80_15345 [Planctomycetaceae bacterium]|nr:hypothetical protein [Planctomycetaceae bacterium]
MAAVLIRSILASDRRRFGCAGFGMRLENVRCVRRSQLESMLLPKRELRSWVPFDIYNKQQWTRYQLRFRPSSRQFGVSLEARLDLLL